ncbi:hypothetical protein [Streptomyces sp. NPDC005548]|uniref:hypothetical protein n=1 Tax=Streptomyces sp. NPDC005548 TaxID=3364724 RepID=UPI0036B8E127
MPGATELLTAYPVFAPAVAVFASGSITQGWAHAKSDLDLFAVMPGPVDKDEMPGLELLEVRTTTEDPVSWIALGEIEQYRADIEVWHAAQVDELVARFATPADKYTVRPNNAEKDLLYRLSKGVALAGEDWLIAHQQALYKSSYGAWLAENQKLDAEGFLEDVEGLLQSGDGHSAALAAHRGVTTALGALLALYDDYSSSQKWLYRRLVAAEPKELSAAEGWAALSMSGCSDDPAGWAATSARLIERMLTAVELRNL